MAMAVTINEKAPIPAGTQGLVLVTGTFTGDTSYPNPGGYTIATKLPVGLIKEMTIMERAHGRHQTDPVTSAPPFGNAGAQIGNGAHYDQAAGHRRSVSRPVRIRKLPWRPAS